MAGLTDRPRSRGPSRITPLQTTEIKALACQPPTQTGASLSRWSCPALAAEAIAQGITTAISASTVRRNLTGDALKPWQYRSWIFIRDPDFATKAARALDFYARVRDGQPLGGNDYAISSDENTFIQARCRHPTLAAGQARTMRVNHEYHLGGALAHLAAYDIHHARVIGLCSSSTGIDSFMELAEEVLPQEPYVSAKRVFWIVDNGSSHRGQKAIDRPADRCPNAVMVHTPIHAS